MASHFKWYPSDEEVVVPWNARYSFPSQANKAQKMTPRIPPKTGYEFSPGQVIRVEFPAQGYVNPLNTTLEFDVILFGPNLVSDSFVRFQNNIQSIFQRGRLLYGANPMEDIINYNVVVRALTEWTCSSPAGTMDQASISDGIGGVTTANQVNNADEIGTGLINVRQAYIQGIDGGVGTDSSFVGFGPVPNNGANGVPGASPNDITAGQVVTVRRYQVNFAFGMFTQGKYIPTKFMASQLAIEFTLEQPAACIFMPAITEGEGTPDAISGTPTYKVTNVNLIPEIIEFDASYDEMFLKGLQEKGIPIKFSSWHTFIFSTTAGSNLNLLIQERSRSVKALFAVQRRNPVAYYYDSGSFLFCSNSSDTTVANTLQNYQYRIGGRYYPASPVQCSTSTGSANSNGAAEAFTELQKALNTVGDYRLSTATNVLRWGLMPFSTAVSPDGVTNLTPYNELDFTVAVVGFENDGRPKPRVVTKISPIVNESAQSSILGSSCFAMAIDLETSNGIEISGLNAEEQSDISLLATYKNPQNQSFTIEVYVYYDALILLRPNNVLDLIF